MSDANHCHTLVSEFFHNVEYLADHFGVERTCRLVKEHHVRLHAQRTNYGDALLLSARKLIRIGIGAVVEPNDFEQLHRLFGGGCFFFFEKLHGSQGHVFQHRHVRKKVKMLKNHAHFLTVCVNVGLFIGDVDVLKVNFTVGWHFEEVE